jgi:hypothetical protein
MSQGSVEGPGGEVVRESGWLHAGQRASELAIDGGRLGAGGATLEVLCVRGGKNHPLRKGALDLLNGACTNAHTR